MNRRLAAPRTLAWAGLAAGLAFAARAARPADRGAAHPPYFRALQAELAREGPGKPVLLLDLDVLDANLAAARAAVRPGLAVRVVAKSLPSIPLLAHVLAALDTTRLMVFDGSVTALVAAFPACDLLVGKPLPARLLERFVDAAPPGAIDRVQWLVDDLARLDAYDAVARARGLRLRINLEVDVGLHRGGFTTPHALGTALLRIGATAGRLRFAGLMGYEPHVASAPRLLSSREGALDEAVARYQAFVDRVRAHDASWLEGATLDGAGSKTYALHRPGGPMNEVALGSCLVLPTDFDVPTLGHHAPAVYIATPVLKALAGTTIPFVEGASRLWPRWDPNRERSYFVFGGGWLARPVSPPGLTPNPIYGFSTNQALLNGSAKTALRADDWVFLRPTQSERVMQELGDILLVRGGRIDGAWPAMPFT